MVGYCLLFVISKVNYPAEGDLLKPIKGNNVNGKRIKMRRETRKRDTVVMDVHEIIGLYNVKTILTDNSI